MRNWDYTLPDNWQPTTHEEWEWFLVRRLHYGDIQGLPKDKVKQYLPTISKRLDPGMAAMLTYYFAQQ